MKLYTSYWQNRDLADLDAQIISISRGQPRWRLPFRYRKLIELAPSKETFAIEDPQEFEAAYLGQLETLGAQEILARLEAVSGGLPVVMLCWERLDKPGEWCHRSLLSDWLEPETGLVVPELEPGMIPARPDAPQPGLF